MCAFTVSSNDLCDYLEADGSISSPATVRRRLYAIRKVHRLPRLPDPTSDEAVNIANEEENLCVVSLGGSDHGANWQG